MNLLKPLLIFYLIANGLAFSVFVVRGTVVSWYVLEETNSTLLVGIITSIPTMTLPILGPLGGRLADSFSKEKVFFYARITIFIVMILMAFFINFNFYSIIFLIVFSIIFGLTSSIENASTQNLLIDIVGVENISRGNGLKEVFNSSLNAILPVTIGLFLTILSSSFIFWALPVIALFALIFGYFTFINFKPVKSLKKIDQDFNEVTVKDGISYVKRNKNIYTLLLLGFGMMVFWAFSQPLLPSYSKDVLNLGGSGYAILNGLYFSGSMIGSLLITFSIIKIKKSRILFLSALLFSIFHILLYNSNAPILSGILIVASGVSHSVWWVSILVYLQTIPDEKYKGRVVGFYFSLLVSVSIGSILGGLISEFIGVRPTVYLAMACLMAIHSIAFMSSKLRKLNLFEKESY
ncbi:MAG: MFS transporter [Dehalococcoidia bacterium]